MAVKFIDTNPLIRYFTRDDKEKAAKVLALLQRVERGEEQLTTSPMVIFETVFTLQHTYKVPRDEIKRLIETVIDLPGIKLPLKSLYRHALDLYVSYSNFSFVDAYNAAYMINFDVTELYSYDDDYDSLSPLSRSEPE